MDFRVGYLRTSVKIKDVHILTFTYWSKQEKMREREKKKGKKTNNWISLIDDGKWNAHYTYFLQI